MKKNKKLNLPPNHPEVVAAVLARLRAMSPDELREMLEYIPEGVEVTYMNEDLAEYDRQQRLKTAEEKVA